MPDMEVELEFELIMTKLYRANSLEEIRVLENTFQEVKTRICARPVLGARALKVGTEIYDSRAASPQLKSRLVNDKFLSIRSIDNRYRIVFVSTPTDKFILISRP
jgi:hypothetical protein